MNNNDQSRNHHEDTVKYISSYDPFVVQTLQTVQNSSVVVQTCDGSIRGKLTDVKPDHIVVESNGSSFFIRIQQIIWVMPT